MMTNWMTDMFYRTHITDAVRCMVVTRSLQFYRSHSNVAVTSKSQL